MTFRQIVMDELRQLGFPEEKIIDANAYADSCHPAAGKHTHEEVPPDMEPLVRQIYRTIMFEFAKEQLANPEKLKKEIKNQIERN